LTTIKDSNTPPETIEDSTSENSYASDDEQTFEQEMEEGKRSYNKI
jgi:hypothetical protein